MKRKNLIPLADEIDRLFKINAELVSAITLIYRHCRPINWKHIDHGYPKESRESIKSWKALDAAFEKALK